MPELPELEVVKAFLNRTVVGLAVEKVEVLRPTVLRFPPLDFCQALSGAVLGSCERRGKFLLLEAGERLLVVNPMLTGLLQYCEPKERRKASTCFVLGLSNGRQLRYLDERQMGRVYLVKPEGLAEVHGYAELGPEPLDPDLGPEAFAARLRGFRGEIKNVLTNQAFIAGVGNAYADEVLFAAGIFPFRKRSQLSTEEVRRLYFALREVLEGAIPLVAQRMGDTPHLKPRDFLAVHGKGGAPCPRCGAPISHIGANQRITNFCRGCQR